MTAYAIETVGLAKSYGTKRVLSGLDLQIPAGRVFALLGPNGAGKTTLINILSTLLKPDAGRALVAGSDVVTQADAVRSSISLTGQYATVDEVLTGRENVIMVARLVGFDRSSAARRAAELLNQFDLVDAADKPVKSYSGGMRRRLDLAIGLITIPPVIFLDEPTTGLDTRSRQALWSVIESLSESGVTVLLTTQYLEEADRLAERIAVINNGTVVAEGSPAELKATVGTDVVELRDENGQLVTEVGTDGTAAGLRHVLDDLDPDARGLRVSVRRPSLDDVFLRLTGDLQPGEPTDSSNSTDSTDSSDSTDDRGGSEHSGRDLAPGKEFVA